MNSSSLPERFHRVAITPDEARERILAHIIRPLDSETVALGDAWNRRLAAAITAPHPFPPFRRSAMDGYAVRADDLPADAQSAPVVLEVLESLPAGTVPRRSVGAGQASRIMTGGMMPDGADTVVMLEMTETEQHGAAAYVRINKPVPRGRNVADMGSEWLAGELLLAPGRIVAAGETALLATCGFASVPVVRSPRVGVLSTGSELLDADAPLVPGRIRNSNTPMLAALLREAGAEAVTLGHVADDVDTAETWVRQALEQCDMLITSGGVSVGDRDVMVDILTRWEGTTLFNKVAMRPGSPTTAALLNDKPLLALSGNPGACFVGFHLFAAPVIRTMLHSDQPRHLVFQARLAEAFTKFNAYPRYIRARIEYREGAVWVRPTGDDKSGLMTTIVGADCLLIVPPLKEGLEKGAMVDAISLREGTAG